jgi:ABC-type transport system involved in cytochrome bd biosynthesis fused ATPase/permease subunit
MFTKIIKILTRTGYLPKSIIIFFVLVVSAALDIIVISIIAPIIFSSLGGDTNKQLDTLDIYNQLENFAPIELLAVALLIVKIIYQLITFNWIYKTAFKIYYDISLEILDGVFKIQKNNIQASKLSVSITSELEEFIKTVLLPIFQMLAELTLITFLIIYLAFLNLALTTFFILFCALIFIFYKLFISKSLNELGLITRSSRLKLIENSQYIAMHNKEIQSLGAIDYFFSAISNVIFRFSKSSAQYQFFLSLPRLIIELLGFLGLLILGILASAINIEGMTLIIFGIATLRMLPAIQRIYVSFTQIKFGERTISFINSIDETLSDKNINEFEEKVLIKSYSNTNQGLKIEINKDNKTYNPNFKYGMNFIIGKSGTGKTTLMYKLLDYLNNSKQKIQCAMMQQGTTVFPGSVHDNIVLNREFDQIRLMELINILFKSDTGRLAPDKILSIQLGDQGKGLSGGQVQRIALTRTLLLYRKVYLIDEGLTSLNPEMRSQIILDLNKWLIKNNSLMIIITHDKDNLSQFPILEIK